MIQSNINLSKLNKNKSLKKSNKSTNKKFNKTYKLKIIHNVLNGTDNSGKAYLDQKILYKLFVA
jgi:hypothetical protein